MDEIDPNPTSVSDPAAIGLPETADDDSHADIERDASRIADGIEPAALPGDRDDGPAGAEDFGTTTGEGRLGESVNGRLAREVPDVSARTVLIDPDPLLAEDLDPDAIDQLADDTDSLADEAVDPHLDSHVSMYDRSVPGLPSTDTVGRLIRADGDGYSVDDPDEVAFDAGLAGGAFSGEEGAMHEVPPRVLDAQEGESEPYVTSADAGGGGLLIRTGSDQPWDPEDLAVAEGRDPTPANVERARRELAQWGPAAIERTVP